MAKLCKVIQEERESRAGDPLSAYLGRFHSKTLRSVSFFFLGFIYTIADEIITRLPYNRDVSLLLDKLLSWRDNDEP